MVEELKIFKESRVGIVDQSEELGYRIKETEILFSKLTEENENKYNESQTQDQELVMALGDDIAFLKNKL